MHRPNRRQLTLGNRIRFALVALLIVYAIGTAGFMLIEGWSLLEAAFMTAITLSTVGYGEVLPLDNAGRIFDIGLIVVGVISGANAISTVAETFIERRFFGDYVRERRMKREIEQQEGHSIVCGYGRVGRHVAMQLASAGKPFVVIEQRRELADACRDAGYLIIEGDATLDPVLEQAGVRRAKGVVTALDSDTANLYITLSCRALRADLFIVARASEDAVKPKFLRAGADRVICPYTLTGRQLADMVSAPNVADVVAMIVNPDHTGLALGDATVGADSPLARRTVGDPAIRERTGTTIIALKRGETITANPPAETPMHPGDTVIAFGTREQLHRFRALARGDAAIAAADST